MKTITVKNVVIQFDAQKSTPEEVKKIVDVINVALQEANLECQPQIILDTIRLDKSISEATFDLRK